MVCTSFSRCSTLFLAVFAMAFPFLAIGLKYAEETTKPVVENFEIVDVQPLNDRDAVAIFVKFDKVRECEFVNLKMFDELGNRVGFVFADENSSYYGGISRPTGEHFTGPWIVFRPSMDGIQIKAFHSCHIGWLSETEMYGY